MTEPNKISSIKLDGNLIESKVENTTLDIQTKISSIQKKYFFHEKLREDNITASYIVEDEHPKFNV